MDNKVFDITDARCNYEDEGGVWFSLQLPKMDL